MWCASYHQHTETRRRILHDDLHWLDLPVGRAQCHVQPVSGGLQIRARLGNEVQYLTKLCIPAVHIEGLPLSPPPTAEHFFIHGRQFHLQTFAHERYEYAEKSAVLQTTVAKCIHSLPSRSAPALDGIDHNSAFHLSGVSKWGSALAGKEKAGMVH